MRAVIFDLYETLVTHFDPEWAPPDRTIAERLGMTDLQRDEHWPSIDLRWQAGEIRSYTQALVQLCDAAGVIPDMTVIAELESEMRANKFRVFERPVPQIAEMIEALKRSGMKLGVITNATDLDAEPWPDSRLAVMFDSFIASYDVGLLKPDRKIYELSCSQLNVEPGEVAYVGDGGSNELQGAKLAGLTPFWCSWFLDRWPDGFIPNGFEGGEWREKSYPGDLPFTRLVSPNDLIGAIL